MRPGFFSPPDFSSLHRHSSLPMEGRVRPISLSYKADALPFPADEDGTFEGYASVFGVMDLGHDVVMPGAFHETLNQRGSEGVKLLWQHDPRQPIGLWQVLVEDRHGLFVRGKLDLETRKGREAMRLMHNGALDGLSIGYRTEQARKDPETGLRRLDRVDLWEISLVTFPLLPQARISRIKECDPGNPARVSMLAPPSASVIEKRT
jgi:uncharacterized protein